MEDLIPDGYVLLADFAECFNYTLEEALCILREMEDEKIIEVEYLSIATPREHMYIPMYKIDLGDVC